MFYTSLSCTSYKYSGTVFPYRRLPCEDIHICNHACRITFLKIPFHYSLTSGSPATLVAIERIADNIEADSTTFQSTALSTALVPIVATKVCENVLIHLIRLARHHFFVNTLFILIPPYITACCFSFSTAASGNVRNSCFSFSLLCAEIFCYKFSFFRKLHNSFCICFS